MPDPWIAVEASHRRSKKLADLPNDSARYGYFVALGECKLLYQAGSFTPGQWKALMGTHARYLRDYMAVGLIHVAPDYCTGAALAVCMRGRGPFPVGQLVLHNWSKHQREHAARQAAYESRTDVGTDVPTDAESDGETDVGSDTRLTPSHARTGALSTVPVSVDGLDTTTGELYQVSGEADERIITWLAATHRIAIRSGNGYHLRIIGWFRQGATEEDIRTAIAEAVTEGARGDRAVILRADEILFPLVTAPRQTPAAAEKAQVEAIVAKFGGGRRAAS